MKKICVSSCPSELAPDSGKICRTCYDVFGDSKKYLKDDVCVEYCSENSYLQIGTSVCSGDCISRCYEVDGSNNVCVDVCGITQFAEIPGASKPSQCVNDCALRFFEDAETGDGAKYRKCITEAACKYYVSEQLDITGEENKQTYSHCYAEACPADTYLKDAAEKECVDSCGGKPYKNDGTNKICVEACNEDKFDYRDGDECRDKCSSGFYMPDNNDNKICITLCSSTQFAEIANNAGMKQCVDTCAMKFF